MPCRTSRISCSASPPAARRSRCTTSSRALTASRNLDWSAATTFNLDEFVGLGPEDPGSLPPVHAGAPVPSHQPAARADQFPDRHRGSRRGMRALRAGDRRGRRHRRADSRHRHQRPYRLQRAGARLRGAHPSGHAEDRDPPQQCGAVRRPIWNRCRPRRCRWGWRRSFRRGRSSCSRTARAKARCVAALVHGPLTTELPASFLQLHHDVDLILDTAAASALSDVADSCSRLGGRGRCQALPAVAVACRLRLTQR